VSSSSLQPIQRPTLFLEVEGSDPDGCQIRREAWGGSALRLLSGMCNDVTVTGTLGPGASCSGRAAFLDGSELGVLHSLTIS
jgi:hypothetical protein